MLSVIRAGRPVNYDAVIDLTRQSIAKLPRFDRPLESRGLYFRNGGLSTPALRVTPAALYHYQLRITSAKMAMQGIVEMLARFGARELYCRIHILEVDISRPDGYISLFLPASEQQNQNSALSER